MIDSDDFIRKSIKRFSNLGPLDVENVLAMVKHPDGTYITREVGFDNGDGTHNVLYVLFQVKVVGPFDDVPDDEDETAE